MKTRGCLKAKSQGVEGNQSNWSQTGVSSEIHTRFMLPLTVSGTKCDKTPVSRP